MLGFLFSASYAVVWLKDVRWRLAWQKDTLERVAGLLLCPLGTAIYMLYLYHHTGDALAQVHVHLAWVSAPPGNPFRILRMCLHSHYWLRIWGYTAVASLVLSAWLFKLRKPELGIYLALSVLISLSGGPFGLPRYIWWQPPFLYAIYRVLARHEGWWVVYMAFASGMASFMILEWFSGHNFVV
jgi:hypothetical protein